MYTGAMNRHTGSNDRGYRGPQLSPETILLLIYPKVALAPIYLALGHIVVYVQLLFQILPLFV